MRFPPVFLKYCRTGCRSWLAPIVLAAMAAGLTVSGAPARAERIKEIASMQGVRTNQLLGYGLVVGLDLSLIHI